MVESNKALYCELFQVPIYVVLLRKNVVFTRLLTPLLCAFAPYMCLCICRTDPHLPDMPIVYASDAFLKLTGAQSVYDSHTSQKEFAFHG